MQKLPLSKQKLQTGKLTLQIIAMSHLVAAGASNTTRGLNLAAQCLVAMT